MYASTRNPIGKCAPGSSSTSVSRIFRSTRSVGSSVRTFLGPSSSPTRTTRPPELLRAESIGSHVCFLADANLVHVSLIDIHSHPQDVGVADGQDRVGRGR